MNFLEMCDKENIFENNVVVVVEGNKVLMGLV